MIGKVLRNNSFRETTRYVLEKEKSKYLDGTMISTETEAISREFMLSKNINPNIERPVYHLIQSYSYEDRDRHSLTNPKLVELSKKHFAGVVLLADDPQLIKEEGGSKYRQRVDDFIETQMHEYQFFIAKHEDTDHIHTHMVASRINVLSGRAIPAYLDWVRSQTVCRELEKEYGLRQLENSWEVDKRKLNPNQKRKEIETGTPPIQTQLQETIENIIHSNRSLGFEEYIEKLQDKDIEVRLHPRGKQIGISYALGGVAMRSSKLGKRYTYQGLQKYFGVKVTPREDIKTTPEKTPPLPVVDPLLEVLQRQDEYANRIASSIQALSIRGLSKDPGLSTLELGSYQIWIEHDEPIRLLKDGRLILEGKKGQWKGYGLSNDDIDAIEHFEQISKHQSQDQQADLQHQADIHRQTNETPVDHPGSYGRGMER